MENLKNKRCEARNLGRCGSVLVVVFLKRTPSNVEWVGVLFRVGYRPVLLVLVVGDEPDRLLCCLIRTSCPLQYDATPRRETSSLLRDQPPIDRSSIPFSRPRYVLFRGAFLRIYCRSTHCRRWRAARSTMSTGSTESRRCAARHTRSPEWLMYGAAGASSTNASGTPASDTCGRRSDGSAGGTSSPIW